MLHREKGKQVGKLASLCALSTMDRDENAAKVILKRVTLEQREITPRERV